MSPTPRVSRGHTAVYPAVECQRQCSRPGTIPSSENKEKYFLTDVPGRRMGDRRKFIIGNERSGGVARRVKRKEWAEKEIGKRLADSFHDCLRPRRTPRRRFRAHGLLL